MYNVAETFVSINGEGSRAGQLAVFVRFQGCNLNCSYCDTGWANQPDAPCHRLNAGQIQQLILETGVHNVTLTGGEPLLQEDIRELLELLAGNEQLNVEIETNGSVPLKPFMQFPNRPDMTMDYKLPSSGMESAMCMENLSLLGACDTIKFVSGSIEDLDRAREIIDSYDLIRNCSVYISPVFGGIESEAIVEYMKKHRMNGVNLQIQLHKVIWDPNTKGV